MDSQRKYPGVSLESLAPGPRSLWPVYLKLIKTQAWCVTGLLSGGTSVGARSLWLDQSLRLWTPESPVSPLQAKEDASVGSYGMVHRMCTGWSPESPPPKRPESPVWPGDSKFPELGGVPSLHRSLQATYPGVSGPDSVQQLEIGEGYK